MTRYDGKGFHPTVRPQIPHRKRERTKLKVFRRILPKAWQLSMMKLGIRFVALESDRFESVELSSCESALLESICVEIGCIGSGTWYVDTNGCGMLQADQANPPPQKGFARKALNWVMVFFMNIGKVLSLAGLMALANACGKDPEPTPTPTPEPTQIEPTYPDTVYVPFEWNMENHNIDPAKNPNIDTIRFYATKPQVKKIVMLLLPADNPYYSSGWGWRTFHRARDTLYVRYDICPEKVCAMGELAATLFMPDSVNIGTQCHRSDSTDLARLGLTMKYFDK